MCNNCTNKSKTQGTIDERKTHTRTNFELQPLFSESQAVTPHSKRTNLPAYQRTIEGPLWPVIYCERHIPTSKSRKPLSQQTTVTEVACARNNVCEYSTAIPERKKKKKKRRRKKERRKKERRKKERKKERRKKKERKKERKKKRNKLVLESFGHLSPGQSERDQLNTSHVFSGCGPYSTHTWGDLRKQASLAFILLIGKYKCVH